MNGLLIHIIIDIFRMYFAGSQVARHLAIDGLRCTGWHASGIIDPVHPLRLARAVCYITGIPGQAHPLHR